MGSSSLVLPFGRTPPRGPAWIDSSTERRQRGSCCRDSCGLPSTLALVAQWIEQRFPKPCVAGSIPAGGTLVMSRDIVHTCLGTSFHVQRSVRRW